MNCVAALAETFIQLNGVPAVQTNYSNKGK